MLRLALLFILLTVAARAFWRLVDGIREGVAGRAARGTVPDRGVQMVRDPVCGMYVIPDRAVTLGEGTGRVFFCSSSCRDKYHARTA